jgi:hypothetical protein
MGGWRHFKETKEYRDREKKKCLYCRARGRDVKFRPSIKSLRLEACNNCAVERF